MDIRNQTQNPCIGYCQADSKGFCLGCGRSREERYLWYQLSEIEQREILQRICVQSLSPLK
ncbi:DUF1289 domain-containing protein [Vibrio brasiliensis]|jgi:predicted Fe-S protein YdhL (DUF1289 family)|uniref:DUF1289 domain-containing protein n=1 Tax=Vibrio brasiliensis TaxID=170652 RepID=UPI001EFDF821|nr:DUF1289 domain-containing protein [Vibrio brasiliensis]MCG9724574.1 DUF1289 domain-containing protein [Vibrio brasiliensis]MCG9751610.1 DUF1289 domain-containing protein [Vibrio brasiliensis]MCG9784154.1 DUF1289 domain-containing protein [Vibrio brasiliensis]